MYLISLILIAMTTLVNTAHDISFTSIDGKEIKLSQFKGKKILIVNTASECGFTPQYKELQKLHEQYQNKLVIIGFPCNDFGQQEPGSENEIKSFCQKNYGVTFLLSEKVSVKNESIHPLFKWLTEQKNTSITGDIMWNFEKFLIDENGNLIERYRSTVSPTSEKITKHLN